MKSMKILAGRLATGFLAIGTILLSACSSDPAYEEYDEIEGGTPVEVSVSMSTVRSNPSDGDGVASDPGSDNEKINSWWIAFVDKNGKVRKILSRTDSETGIASDAAAVEEESFKCKLSPGIYDIYAFANVTAEELKTATGLDFAAGATVSNVDAAVWNTSLNNFDTKKPIPMSGFRKGVRVRNTIEESFSIEVVRMVAKMEFQISNISDGEVTVNSLTVDPVTTSAISLFPRSNGGISYAHLGKSAYEALENPTYAPLTVAVDGGKTFAAEADAQSLCFYMQESLSSRANSNAFTIGVNLQHKNGVADYEQFSITRDVLSYINRNDHIVIPVQLSRYDVEVVAVAYPPIGGYPAVASTTDPKGAQIFTFTTGGDFSIVAHVTDKQTGTHVAPVYYKVTVSEPEGDTGIFTTAPTVTSGSVALPDEVNGVLGTTTGTVSLTLTVSVYDKPHYEEGAQVKNSYTRKIYIVRKSNA